MRCLFYFAILVNGLPLAMIAPFYPPLAIERGMGANIVGMVMAVRPLG